MFKYKKLAISLGSLSTLGMSVITVVSCSKGDLTYKIVIDNAKDKNYTLSTQDVNYQPINLRNGTSSFWDIKSTDEKDALDKIIGAKASQKFAPGIKNEDFFQNGLDKLIYDILIGQDHDIDLTLTYTIEKGNSPEITIPKSVMESKGNKLETARFRADQLKSKLVKPLTETFKNIKLIKFDETNRKFSAAPATESEWIDSIDNMLSKVKK